MNCCLFDWFAFVRYAQYAWRFLSFIILDFEQVSEEVERALAKLGPAKLSGRYGIYFSLITMQYQIQFF